MALGRGLSSLIPPKKNNDSVKESVEKHTELLTHVFAPLDLSPAAQNVASSAPPVSSASSLPPFRLPDKTHDEPLVPDSEVVPEIPQVDPVGPSSSTYSKGSGFEDNAIIPLEVESIKPNPYQPRREFKESDLQELAQSIREFGIIQPLVVSRLSHEVAGKMVTEYQLIAGERRLQAAKRVGLSRVPVIVRKTDSNREKLELAIIENLQRTDLNPVETARAYARLQDEFGLTQREVAARVGKSREVVANTLRLLNLPSHMQEALTGGKINESQARVLLSVNNIDKQQKSFDNLLNERMTVRSLKNRVTDERDPESEYIERELEERLGAPIKLTRHGETGRIIISFYSKEELDNIAKKLMNN